VIENNIFVALQGALTYGCDYKQNTFVAKSGFSAPYGIIVNQYAKRPRHMGLEHYVGFDYGIMSDQKGGPSPVARNNVSYPTIPGVKFMRMRVM